MSQTFNFVKIFSDVCAPSKATPMSVGFDLESYEDNTIDSNGIYIVRTGLKVHPPLGTFD